MGGAPLGLSALPGAGQAVGNRHALSTRSAQFAGKADSRILQANSKLAGFSRFARARSPVAAPAAANHTERQRDQSSRADSTAPAQALKTQRRSRQNRLPARAVFCPLRASENLSQANRTGRHGRRDEGGL